MKLHSIELKNFKPFRDIRIPDSGVLPDGLILIRGENSTGKSSLFEAILWALWGPAAVSPNNDELVNFSSSYCKVILEFEVAGTDYKIQREYNQADGMSVILFAKLRKNWKRVADKSMSVATKIEEILNLELSQALSTLLVRQGEVALIANATPSVLRNLLVKVYNIELLNQMTGHLENLESDLSNREEILRDEFVPEESIQQMIKEISDRLQELEQELSEKQKVRDKEQKLLDTLPKRDMIKSVHELISDREKKQREYDQSVHDRDSDLEYAGLASPDEKVIEARLALLTKELEQLEDESKSNETEQTKANQDIGHLKGKVTDLREKVSGLEKIDKKKGTVDCPTCAKPLSAKERSDLLSQYEADIKKSTKQVTELEAKQKQYTSRSKEINTRIRSISSAIEAIRRIKAKHKSVLENKAELDELEKSVQKALKDLGMKDIESLLQQYEVTSMVDLQTKITEIETRVKSITNECTDIEEDIKKENELLKNWEEKAVKSRQIGAEIEELKQLGEHTRYVRLKLLNGFVADYVVQKRLIGIIRGATNPYVQAFTNNQYTSIDLVPTPAKGRSGAGLVLTIRDERDNATKKTRQLSFGDRTAISLALRLGISRTMSAIRPTKDSPAVSPRVRCVLLDEPLGGLDRNRRVSVVRNLVNDSSFEQLFLITHTDIQDWDEVPVIDISKSGTSSSVTLRS